MIYRFDPNDSFIAVEAVLVGPVASDTVILALDTGASQTALDQTTLAFLGFDPAQPIGQVSVITANGIVTANEFQLGSVAALGIDMRPMDVIAMVVQGGGFEGLLGKDFFRDRVLKIDFRNGTIEVN